MRPVTQDGMPVRAASSSNRLRVQPSNLRFPDTANQLFKAFLLSKFVNRQA